MLLATKLSDPGMPSWATRFLAWLLALVAATRGLDYVLGDPVGGPALRYVVALAPLDMWGLAFLVAGTLLGAGLSLQRHIAVWIGHGLLGIVYLTLAIALGQAAASLGDGWRGTGTFLTLSALHLLRVLLLRPIPRRQE
ncbi:hypothetical protein ABN028_20005 [Actinopolymorpha sp. B17G11]